MSNERILTPQNNIWNYAPVNNSEFKLSHNINKESHFLLFIIKKEIVSSVWILGEFIIKA